MVAIYKLAFKVVEWCSNDGDLYNTPGELQDPVFAFQIAAETPSTGLDAPNQPSNFNSLLHVDGFTPVELETLAEEHPRLGARSKALYRLPPLKHNFGNLKVIRRQSILGLSLLVTSIRYGDQIFSVSYDYHSRMSSPNQDQVQQRLDHLWNLPITLLSIIRTGRTSVPYSSILFTFLAAPDDIIKAGSGLQTQVFDHAIETPLGAWALPNTDDIHLLIRPERKTWTVDDHTFSDMFRVFIEMRPTLPWFPWNFTAFSQGTVALKDYNLYGLRENWIQNMETRSEKASWLSSAHTRTAIPQHLRQQIYPITLEHSALTSLWSPGGIFTQHRIFQIIPRRLPHRTWHGSTAIFTERCDPTLQYNTRSTQCVIIPLSHE